jgi:type IV pilus assembly protein PilM
VLALNIGASKLVLAEFTVRSGQPPLLTQYGIGELGIEVDSETDASAYIVAAIRDLMRDRGIRPAPLLMTVSGQAVFPRFVRLPAVARDKMQQMVQLEAEQNVPFPISEVVWDYQLIGDSSSGEQNVMIVAVKTESVTALTDCVLSAGLEPEIVDVAPMALCNCVRYNYPDLGGCTMILDVGARSTNLVFVEEERIFSRSIPVAGNAITQELAKSFQLNFREAEALKRQHAVVALGGVYSMTEDETTDRVSKVVRNVITRLHAEVNRSINFYRSQQGGEAPQRVLLTGGSATMPHMDTFFREKLKVDVDYLNPFANVAVGGRASPEQASEDFHQLGEVVGLALRRSVPCPVRINLMPPDLVKQKIFRRRLPFFGLAAAGLVATLLTWSFHASQQLRLYKRQQTAVEKRVKNVSGDLKRLTTVQEDRQAAEARAEELRLLVERRAIWSRVLTALRDCLYDGMWLTQIETLKDPDGRVVRLRLTGRGFTDKLKAAEAAAGGRATAAELLRDKLKGHAVFCDDVAIRNEREADRQPVREFTIEAALNARVAAVLSGRGAR